MGYEAEAVGGRLAEQGAQVVGLGVAESHHPGSKAAQRPRPFAEHLAVIMAGVRQDAVVAQPPNSEFRPFEHLQKPSIGRVAQYAGDVVQSIVRMALAEQNRQRGSSWGETTAAVLVYSDRPGSPKRPGAVSVRPSYALLPNSQLLRLLRPSPLLLSR